MAVNECIPYYEPAERITGHAAVALTGKRLCDIVADRQAQANLKATTPAGAGDPSGGGNLIIGAIAAGARAFGVVSHDVAAGRKVTVLRGPGFILPIRTAVAIARNAQVQAAADGTVVPLTTGVAIGFAVTAAVAASDAQIALY